MVRLCFVSGSGAPERSRKTDDDFFLFSQQQGTGGERSKMPKPVSTSGTGLVNPERLKSHMRQTLGTIWQNPEDIVF